MNNRIWIVGMVFFLSNAGWAQGVTASGDASARGTTSVSADRSGASATHGNGAASQVATQGASAGFAEGTELNATLSRRLDAGKAKPGDEVTATLTQDVQSQGRVVVHRGATLVGRVTEARPRRRRAAQGEQDSRLGFVFDKAVLEDGREVPLNATISAIAAAGASATGSTRGFDTAGAGRTAGSGRAVGGGTLGGVGGISRVAGLGSVGSTHSTMASVAGGVAGGIGGTIDTVPNTVPSASAGAIGGLNATGKLASGSRGVFGMRNLDIVSTAANSSSGNVLTSGTRDVELGRGTQMLLSTQGTAAGQATAASRSTSGNVAAAATGNAAGNAGGAATGNAASSAAGAANGAASSGGVAGSGRAAGTAGMGVSSAPR